MTSGQGPDLRPAEFSEAAGDTLALTGGALVLVYGCPRRVLQHNGGRLEFALYRGERRRYHGLTIEGDGGVGKREVPFNQSGGNDDARRSHISADEARSSTTLRRATYDILDDSRIRLGSFNGVLSRATPACWGKKLGGAGTKLV